jgi:hypothetical protein
MYSTKDSTGIKQHEHYEKKIVQDILDKEELKKEKLNS